MDKKTFKSLLQRYNAGTASADEKNFIEAYYAAFGVRPHVIEQLSIAEQEKLEEVMFEELLSRLPAQRQQAAKERSSVSMRWYRIAAAASVVILLGIGIYFYTIYYKQQSVVAINIPKDFPAPASNRAMITLADGSMVYLDSVGSGQLAQVGNIQLVKLANGQIAYIMADEIPAHRNRNIAGAHNTLTNPRGSKVIDMQLSDGTHVWLNAGSSITYPVAFSGNERKVALNGEGYFEVAKDPRKKFIVVSGNAQTEVLGTHFNINAYNNENGVRVSLLEGRVKVLDIKSAGKNGDSEILAPGQQAQIANGIEVIRNANMEMVMAWKNGSFEFDNALIPAIMRELSRWYNIEVVYKRSISQHFMGSISREVPLSKVLEMLESTGAVNFELSGNVVTVY